MKSQNQSNHSANHKGHRESSEPIKIRKNEKCGKNESERNNIASGIQLLIG